MARLRGHRKTKAPRGMVSKKRLTYMVIAVASVVSLIFIYIIFSSPNSQQTVDNTLPMKAAIIDQLNATYPNSTFRQTATSILESGRFNVTYFDDKSVTVSFYKNLPTYGFGIIIFRVHSTEKATLFTSERNETATYLEYLDMLYNDQLSIVAYDESLPERYFGVRSAFVRDIMNGRFQNTIIINMGCDGLKSGTTMAPAFINRGAKVYVSWNGTVLANQTDQATTMLLRYLVQQKFSVRNAVEKTMQTVGPDPEFSSVLMYYPLYPLSAGDFVIPSIQTGTTANLVDVIAVAYFKKQTNCLVTNHNVLT